MNDLETPQKEIAKNKDFIIEKLVEFALTDTLLFWGNEKDLIEKQQEMWTPILQWANKKLEVELEKTQDLEIPEANTKSGEKIKKFLQSLTDKELTAFYKSALLMKSVLLAMAFVKKQINANQAFEASLLEERWQNQIWGTTDEVADNQEKYKKELIEIESFLNN